MQGAELLRNLLSAGLTFYTGVPDSTLGSFCRALSEGEVEHNIAANEGNAIAAAAGYWLSTGRAGLVFLQNSGLGNAINPLASLVHKEVYAIPMVLLIGWRGMPGHKDEPQHQVQGAITSSLLELLDIPQFTLSSDSDVGVVVKRALEVALDTSSPTAILVPPGFLSSDSGGIESGWLRSDAIGSILPFIGNSDIVVGTTGYISRDLYQRFKDQDALHRLMVSPGAMGHASQLACGIARGLSTSQRVWCFDGDGAALMHLGSMAAIAAEAPQNLVHVIIDNGVHASVGGTRTCAPRVDFSALGRAVGYRSTHTIETDSQIAPIEGMLSNQGPILLHVKVVQGERKQLTRPVEKLTKLRDKLVQFVRPSSLTRVRCD